MLELLKQGHQRAVAKIGSGIEKFVIKSHPKHTATTCFFLIRENETEEDFSYLKCIETFYPKPDGPQKGKRGNDRRDKKRGPPQHEGQTLRPNILVKITGLKEGIHHKDVKPLFDSFQIPIAFVDCKPSQTILRFPTAEDAQQFLEKVKASEDHANLTCGLVEGQEEAEYWDKNIINPTKKSKDEKVFDLKKEITPGILIKVTGLKEGINRTEVKALFTDFLIDLRFVDVHPEYTIIRFRDKEDTEKFHKKAVWSSTFKNQKFSVLSGEEEEKYWEENILKNRRVEAPSARGGRGGARGGARGGRGAARGRSGKIMAPRPKKNKEGADVSTEKPDFLNPY
eukprot:TRINITY_DN4581_c0_g1_i1.p2 TRINITY_DN4581_c0_g1~~TRINITY_DN4581_c0_g1_i1.p2  ORF type:complete len:396 (-),score=115.18 TRINITY_DN4581_c0_g1_i1:72-1091(-)